MERQETKEWITGCNESNDHCYSGSYHEVDKLINMLIRYRDEREADSFQICHDEEMYNYFWFNMYKTRMETEEELLERAVKEQRVIDRKTNQYLMLKKELGL